MLFVFCVKAVARMARILNDRWTEGDKKLLQTLVQHKVVCEKDLLSWFHKWVLQQEGTGMVVVDRNSSTSDIKEYFTTRLGKYKE